MAVSHRKAGRHRNRRAGPVEYPGVAYDRVIRSFAISTRENNGLGGAAALSRKAF
jgi:hypothetical protein